MTCQFLDLPEPEEKTMGQLVSELSFFTRSVIERQLEHAGWMTMKRFMDLIMRGTAFNEILSVDSVANPYKFPSWLRKWEDFLTAFDQAIPGWEHSFLPPDTSDILSLWGRWYYSNAKMFRVTVEQEVDVIVSMRLTTTKSISLIDQVRRGLPTLDLPGLFKLEPNIPNWDIIPYIFARQYSGDVLDGYTLKNKSTPGLN